MNGIDYTEVVEANSPNDLRFSRNRMFLVNLHYNLKGDYMKCVCDQDRNNEIAVGTEFIFYPHDINEDTPMMATWRESLDVKSDTLWMTEDGTSWFIRSETREEAVINGVAFSDIDISNFPGELYLKKDDEYALVFVYWTQTDDYVELYCRHDRDQITEKNIWRFYPHDIDE